MLHVESVCWFREVRDERRRWPPPRRIGIVIARDSERTFSAIGVGLGANEIQDAYRIAERGDLFPLALARQLCSPLSQE